VLVNGVDDQAGEVPSADPQAQLAKLTRQVENLQQAVVSRQRIGVAVGLLAHRLDCNVDQAWKLLAWISQTTNVKARIVAQVLVAHHSRQLSPDDAELSATIESLLPRTSAAAPKPAGNAAADDGPR
jgi:hypothetical protein